MSASKDTYFAPLTCWLSTNGISQAELGRRVGRPRRDIHRLVAGLTKRADPALLAAIERETRGAVTPADFIAFMTRTAA